MPNNTINFIDLFCGAGGFAKGFELTGKFKCIGAIDNNPAAVKTHKLNFFGVMSQTVMIVTKWHIPTISYHIPTISYQ